MKTWSRRIICGICLAVAAGGLRAEVAILSVTSGASFESGLPPKGSIATIFCRGLTGIDKVAQASGTPLPFTLAGVRVVVGGATAPLFAVAPGEAFQQINIQVPQEARIVERENVEVRVMQGEESALTVVPQRLLSPGDFFRLADGSGIFQRAVDFSLVTADNPVRPGEYVIAYLTGMIGTRPVVPTGEPSPFDPLAVVLRLNEEVYIDNYRVTLAKGNLGNGSVVPEFMGLTPGSIGVYQVNFRYLPAEFVGTQVDVLLGRQYCRPSMPSFITDCRSPENNPISGRVKMWVGK